MKARLALLCAALVAGLGACGGDGDDGSDTQARAVSVRIDRPADGTRTRSRSITVVGTATGAAEVTVNGKPATLRPAGAARSFEVPVRLRVGENEIVVEARGGGQAARQAVTVIRRRGRARDGGRESDPGGSGGEPAEAPPSQGAPPAPSQGAPGAPAAPPNQGAPPSPSAPPPQGAPPGGGPPNQGAPPAPAPPQGGPPSPSE